MIIRWINAREDEIAFGPDNKDQYKVRNLEGFGNAPAQIQTQKAPFQDGETLIDQLLEPRNLTLEIMIIGNRQTQYERRRLLQNLFNTKLGSGQLQWKQDDGATYEIECVPDGSPQFPGGNGQSSGHQTVLINLRAPGPYWKDPDLTIAELAKYLGGLEMPFEFNMQFGDGASTKNAVNKGDVPTPVIIELEGPAINPEVVNQTTGKKMKIQQSLESDELVRINTAFGQKEVTLIAGDGTETNVMHWLTDDSEFFNLVVGDNVLNYTEESGAKMTIKFYNRYVGV